MAAAGGGGRIIDPLPADISPLFLYTRGLRSVLQTGCRATDTRIASVIKRVLIESEAHSIQSIISGEDPTTFSSFSIAPIDLCNRTNILLYELHAMACISSTRFDPTLKKLLNRFMVASKPGIHEKIYRYALASLPLLNETFIGLTQSPEEIFRTIIRELSIPRAETLPLEDLFILILRELITSSNPGKLVSIVDKTVPRVDIARVLTPPLPRHIQIIRFIKENREITGQISPYQEDRTIAATAWDVFSERALTAGLIDHEFRKRIRDPFAKGDERTPHTLLSKRCMIMPPHPSVEKECRRSGFYNDGVMHEIIRGIYLGQLHAVNLRMQYNFDPDESYYYADDASIINGKNPFKIRHIINMSNCPVMMGDATEALRSVGVSYHWVGGPRWPRDNGVRDTASIYGVARFIEAVTFSPRESALFPPEKLTIVELFDGNYRFIKRPDGIQPFTYAFSLIDEAIKKNQRLFIHCVSGMSRSATLVIAYLMTLPEFEGSLELTLRFVRAMRLITNPNKEFMKLLLAYERFLKGE